MHIAVNGWQLTENPESPDSAQLVEWLREFSSVESAVSWTLIHPPSEAPSLPERIERLEIEPGRSTWARFRFEQWLLPRAAHRVQADLLLSPYTAAPLTSPVPVVILFTGSSLQGKSDLVGRLRWAFGRAGVSDARRVLAFDDEPALSILERHAGKVDLEPWVGRHFRVLPEEGDREVRSTYDLGAAYVLCHGLRSADAPGLAAAWTWVDGSVGDAIPLVVCGLEAEALRALKSAAQETAVEHSIRPLPSVPYEHLPALYRGGLALLRTARYGNGQVLRWAMACGVPVVVPHEPRAAAIVGDAGYLVPPDDTRAMGAAALTLVVENQLHERLKQRGLLRAADYHRAARRAAAWRALTSAA